MAVHVDEVTSLRRSAFLLPARRLNLDEIERLGALVPDIVEVGSGTGRGLHLIMSRDVLARYLESIRQPAQQQFEAGALLGGRPLLREISQKHDADASGVVLFDVRAQAGDIAAFQDPAVPVDDKVVADLLPALDMLVQKLGLAHVRDRRFPALAARKRLVLIADEKSGMVHDDARLGQVLGDAVGLLPIPLVSIVDGRFGRDGRRARAE